MPQQNLIFWTQTAHVGLTPAHWTVNFEGGVVTERANALIAPARCVRGPVVTSKLTIVGGCSIVFDATTGLAWQRIPTGQTLGWLAALDHCENLEQDGFRDWRLPNIKELQTIVDDTRLDPAINVNAFPGTPSELFWSSSPYIGDPSFAWAVNFTEGAAIHSAATSAARRVRCVRGG
jgi:hypothetical protein